MGIVIVDGIEVEVRDDERLNGIQAAARAGVSIPHYCWHPGLTVVGSCRMCLVETGTRDAATGAITMLPKLVPACNTLARDGVVIVTQSEKVQQARAMVEEGLLLRHPIDCPICDKAGECLLQDYHFEHGQAQRRADIQPFTSRRRDVGSSVTLFVDRCVMCSRCVRFTREITGTGELMVIDRGSHEEIDVLPGFPLDNKLSGNVVDLCPVGALGDKDFLYRQRVWFMRRHPGVCTACATGCSIWVEENQDRVYRIKPRENLEVNEWWICNDGRYDYPHVHSDQRIVVPEKREAGVVTRLDWTRLPQTLNEQLRSAGRMAAVLSPFLTVEEAWLLASYARSIDPEALLAVGPIPVVGEDETFPNGFTISAEKCPNRRGVEEVVGHFMGRTPGPDDLLQAVDAGEFQSLWVSGGYRRPWIDEETAKRLAKVPLVIVQDLFPSPLSERATYVLPAGAYAEREGSYVNRGDHLQTARRAIRPPTGVRPEGSLLWELLGRKGLYNAGEALHEAAVEIPYFRAAAGPVPDTGINLKINLLAEDVSDAAQRMA